MSYVFKHYTKGSTQGSGSYVFRKYSENVQPQVEPYITFSSTNSFFMLTNNQSKGWDGTIEYSTDGVNWTAWNAKKITSGVVGGVNVLYLRGTSNTYIVGSNTSSYFSLSGTDISLSGNIETLLDYQEVLQGNHPPMASQCFNRLFMSQTALTDITGLEMPATTLSANCYDTMFSSSGVVNVPANLLPATTLSVNCYYRMFKNCASLLNTPNLPATTLNTSCCFEMFTGCTGLVTAPVISATTLAQGCFQNMFQNCTNLEQLPALSALDMSVFTCYYQMFRGCSKIKLSAIQTGNYQNAYRIPVTGTGTTQQGIYALDDMFSSTGGTFTGKPNINQTYYTSNAIVNADGTITPAVN